MVPPKPFPQQELLPPRKTSRDPQTRWAAAGQTLGALQHLSATPTKTPSERGLPSFPGGFPGG